MSETYSTYAAEALKQGVCPDCGRNVVTVRAEAGEVVKAHECPTCDTEWTPRAGEPAPPEGVHAPAWRRLQRSASVVATRTGRHPFLEVVHEALVAYGLDPATLPALVNAPLMGFPYTADEADRFDRNGALMFMPPTGTAHPFLGRTGDDEGPAQVAARRLGEDPYGGA